MTSGVMGILRDGASSRSCPPYLGEPAFSTESGLKTFMNGKGAPLYHLMPR